MSAIVSKSRGDARRVRGVMGLRPVTGHTHLEQGMHHRVHAVAQAYQIEIRYVPGGLGDLIGYSDLDTRTVTVNLNLTPVELTSTVMHEIAHIVLGHSFGENDLENERMERLADEWAARELVDDRDLMQAILGGRGLRGMAEICRVDERVMAARLRVAERAKADTGPMPVIAPPDVLIRPGRPRPGWRRSRTQIRPVV